MNLVQSEQVHKSQKTIIMAIFNNLFRFLPVFQVLIIPLFKQLIVPIALFNTSGVKCDYDSDWRNYLQYITSE